MVITMTQLLIRNIALPYLTPECEALIAARAKVSKILSPSDIREMTVTRRSVDARKKKDIRFIYTVAIFTDKKLSDRQLESCSAIRVENDQPEIIPGSEKLTGRIVVIGMGPAGMFCALTLAKRGYFPIVIERGKSALERKKDIEHFFDKRELNTDSNVQFGAGGAGTFSDGKLITRVNDAHCKAVLEELVRCGAPKEILSNAKPHVGTDRLVNIVEKIDSEIRENGGEILYETTFRELIYKGDKLCGIRTDRGDIGCSLAVLATGHSSRDTYEYLIDSGFNVIPKDFSCGVRIEHLASDIDEAMYGDADISLLGHAEYTLSLRNGERGVYTFCMCPGGSVIAATSEEKSVVVNGMSYYKRDMTNSNSAIAVSVLKKDYGNDPRKAIEFQRTLEKNAFILGGADYSVPIQTVGDFLGESKNSKVSRVVPSYMGGHAYNYAELSNGLPQFITSMLKSGIAEFDKKISGFASPSAILSGYETRTSAPVRILRGDDLVSENKNGVYPCGEGAGYAGGITSAAADGMRVAEKIISVYAPVG